MMTSHVKTPFYMIYICSMYCVPIKPQCVKLSNEDEEEIEGEEEEAGKGDVLIVNLKKCTT